VIEIQNEFKVPADPSTVYDYLLELEQVGQCIPGAQVGPAADGGAHPAEIVVKLGPMRFNYQGSVRLEDRVEPELKATLRADLREARGQGSANARMEMSVEGEDNGARVVTRTEVQLTGRAASMGRGVIDDVAARMVDDMAACVTQRLGSRPAGAAPSQAVAAAERPIGGIRLMLRVLWGKLFKRRR
jgi:carbon monoxide dehydrogenase subunit G